MIGTPRESRAKLLQLLMKNLFIRGAFLAALLLALLVAGVRPAAAADCSSLRHLALQDTTITSAAIVPATGFVPEYCKVLGSIHNLRHSTILFEVALPTTKWNGKYFVAGGGGFNGTIPNLDQALEEGYAAAGSDTGHKASDKMWALNNLDAQNNYAYLATHVATLLGKQILQDFYGHREQRSYFVGCSNGGKMALAEVQRYPDDFDGVIAGDPVIDRTKLMMQFAWDAQALAPAPIPPSKIPVIEKATLKACRQSGDEINGLIMTPGRCRFDPKTIMCPSGDGPNCLTAGQVQALHKILTGPVNSAGVQLYPGFVPGHEEDYSQYITGSGTENAEPSSSWNLQDIFMRQFVFGMSFDSVKQFNLDRDPAALAPLAPAQDNANPDLSLFKAHGGKLILYHGWADHSITPLRTIEYYAKIIDTMGKDQTPGSEDAAQVTGFVRLFMAPGMHHCGLGHELWPNVFGGPFQGLAPQADAQHDVVMALDQWVEDGVAPEKLIASHITNGAVDRSIPMCPYPQIPVYNGTGDANLAENYHCEERPFRWPVEAVQGMMNWGRPAHHSAARKKPVRQSKR
ncbi:MAG TPA: tannase/feruloyl esterase family alpha/beta hydrolase [Candidatus Dormibacteraeota bacterium]|nr:tannase/feruloyl esterase family alpha/beta hydrolase [Candidatus Dormibacteraeota bacterium]